MLRMITISIEAEEPAEQGVRPGYHDPHDVHNTMSTHCILKTNNFTQSLGFIRTFTLLEWICKTHLVRFEKSLFGFVLLDADALVLLDILLNGCRYITDQ